MVARLSRRRSDRSTPEQFAGIGVAINSQIERFADAGIGQELWILLSRPVFEVECSECHLSALRRKEPGLSVFELRNIEW